METVFDYYISSWLHGIQTKKEKLQRKMVIDAQGIWRDK